ncbi:MAG: hypothetical protein ACYCV7_03820, partial [Acidimicrobiales bacterium]
DEANTLVFGEYDYEELMDIEATDGDPDVPGRRLECFAHCLWDAIRRSIVNRAESGPAGGEVAGVDTGGGST